MQVLDSIGMYHLRNEAVDNLAYGPPEGLRAWPRADDDRRSSILLDRPAAGLSPSERREFCGYPAQCLWQRRRSVPHRAQHGRCHEPEPIITVLNFGCKIAEGTPEEIQHDPRSSRPIWATFPHGGIGNKGDFRPEKRLLLLMIGAGAHDINVMYARRDRSSSAANSADKSTMMKTIMGLVHSNT